MSECDKIFFWKRRLDKTPTPLKQNEKYEVLEEVGQGGMAIVYRGLDRSLKREVAIKILHPHLAKERESKQRFQREAQAVAKLRHDNILEIYDYSGLESEDNFIVTEFIRGQTLKEFLAKQPISQPEIAAMVVLQVAEALEHAHKLKIIHRDIKPENIMIRSDGRIKLTDFGIAQIVDVQKLTLTGQLLGSPAYMAPELIAGKPLDYRCDIFSMGTLLYQLSVGELPFRGRNPLEVLKRISDGQFTTPQVINPLVDSSLASIIAKALAHKPDERYQTIEEFSSDIRQFLEVADLFEPEKELEEYFKDSERYTQELQSHLVLTLTKKGQDALKKSNSILAFSLFNRVLCIDPKNPTVRAYLSQKERRQKLIHIGLFSLSFIMISVGIYSITSYISQQSAQSFKRPLRAGKIKNDSFSPAPLHAPPKDIERIKDVGLIENDIHPIADLDAENSKAKKIPSDITAAAKPRVTPSPLIEKRKFIINPHPKALSIYIGNKRLGTYGPDLRQITLPPGKHVITFRNEACCFDKRIIIDKNDKPKALNVRLAWKPAQVKINIVPKNANATIIIGSLSASAGQPISVPLPISSVDGQKKIIVKISAENYLAVAKPLVVSANQNKTLTITLKKAAGDDAL